MRNFYEFRSPDLELAINVMARREAKEKTLKREEERAFKNEFKTSLYVVAESKVENLEVNDKIVETGNADATIELDTGVSVSLELDDFFKRPVLIYDFPHCIGFNATDQIDPWDLWVTATGSTVMQKLAGYAYFKGDLNLRICVTSDASMYGSIMFSYQPFGYQNPTVQAYRSAGDPLMRTVKVCYYSQSPETAYAYLGEDTTIDMKIPFIWPKRAVKLYNANPNVITNATGYDEFKLLGRLLVDQVMSPRSVLKTGTANPFSIMIYAWATDVELGGLTRTFTDIVSEGKKGVLPRQKFTKKKVVTSDSYSKFASKINSSPMLNGIAGTLGKYANDEYADAGPISKIASGVSNLASKLSNVPIINNFATPASFAAGKIASVASWFGFSRPSNIEPIVIAKNQALSNMAFYETKDGAVKLTGDPKQELAIVSVGTNDNKDPMAFASIVSREALFDQIPWQLNASPTLLATYPISPCALYASVTNSETDTYNCPIIQHTPLSFVGNCFRYWRGTISLRFVVVTNSYFGGKLLFVYEPNRFLPPQVDPVLSTNFNYLLDLQAGNEITIDIEYESDEPFTRSQIRNDSDSLPSGVDHYKGSIAVNNFQLQEHNGYLYVYCFSPLRCTTAETSNEFTFVQVFVSSPDMEFAVPRHITNSEYSNLFIQAESKPETTAVESSESIPPTTMTLNMGTKDVTDLYRHSFGEAVYSFRSLLKRSEQIMTSITAKGIVCPHFPQVSNRFVNGRNNSHIVSTLKDVHPAGYQHTLFNYLRFAFIGMRGGMRYRIVSIGETVIPVVNVTNLDTNFTDTLLETTSTTMTAGMGGCHLFTDVRSCEFETPYYSSNYFDVNFFHHPSLISIPGITTAIRNTETCGFAITQLQPTQVPYILYAAAADDFSYFRFQGAPAVTFDFSTTSVNPITSAHLVGGHNSSF